MANRGSPLATFETAFDVYKAWSILGEGGAGRVFEATTSDGVSVAIKVLRPEVSSSDKRKRFKNEIDFLSKDRHRGIIRVLDSGVYRVDQGSSPFYVMPRIPSTLRAYIRSGIASNRVLPLFDQVLCAIDAAHRLGVVHRDLKPENILHDPERDLLLVADFGVAHFEEEDLLTAVESKQNDRLANFLYAAPEQRTRGAVVDQRADVFALGLLLNEMFTGQVPQGAGFRTIASVVPNCAYLDELVERMRQQSPGNRPGSVEEVQKELIRRGNEFVALQRLDEKRREVVPAYQAGEVEPVRIQEADWNGTVLTVLLNREPEHGWLERFRDPRGGWSELMGKGPASFRFTGRKVQNSATEQQVQALLDNLRNYLTMATEGYQQDLRDAAVRKQGEERNRLRQEQQIAEQRARVMKNLRY